MKEIKGSDFENFLQEEHADDYHGTDDNMPDAFEAWVTDLQVDDLINYANIYANKRFFEGYDKAKETALSVIKGN